MEPLRHLQRRALQQLFQEFSASNARRASARHQSLLQAPGDLKNSGRTYSTARQAQQQHQSSSRIFSPDRLHSPNQALFTARRAIPRRIQQLRQPRRYNSTSQTTPNKSLPEPNTLSGRLKRLSREYGWSALGVYLLLSALDFPFCFLAVRTLGTERIGHWEHVVVTWAKTALQWPLAQLGWETGEEGIEQGSQAVRRELKEGLDDVDKLTGEEKRQRKIEASSDKRLLDMEQDWEDHGVTEAEKANQSDAASLWTQLALAYAIHKSFIFIRVPLTAAVLPKVVKTLRGWGWKIGKMPAKKVKEGGAAAAVDGGVGVQAQKGTRVNVSGGGKKSSS